MFVCHKTLLYLILLYKITNKRKKTKKRENHHSTSSQHPIWKLKQPGTYRHAVKSAPGLFFSIVVKCTP